MKRKVRLVQASIGAFMGIVLCGCPEIHQDNLGPVGFIVRMDTDYSQNIMALKFSEHDYLVKCGYGHTIPLTNNYYYVTDNYVSIVYTIWNESECNDSIRSLNQIGENIENEDPFVEVYTVWETESINDLVKRTDTHNFKGLTKEK
ncbi:MAG: hypothetical protein MJZ00_04520 [Paludibacteraceae bacterium]|nr:hypothetical protein [Paludibacteraceae bacterium]